VAMTWGLANSQISIKSTAMNIVADVMAKAPRIKAIDAVPMMNSLLKTESFNGLFLSSFKYEIVMLAGEGDKLDEVCLA